MRPSAAHKDDDVRLIGLEHLRQGQLRSAAGSMALRQPTATRSTAFMAGIRFTGSSSVTGLEIHAYSSDGPGSSSRLSKVLVRGVRADEQITNHPCLL